MNISNSTRTGFAVTLIATFALAGCGGGGGGAPGITPPPPPQIGSTILQASQHPKAQKAISDSTQKLPKAGSVIQSSNDNTTAVAVTVSTEALTSGSPARDPITISVTKTNSDGQTIMAEEPRLFDRKHDRLEYGNPSDTGIILQKTSSEGRFWVGITTDAKRIDNSIPVDEGTMVGDSTLNVDVSNFKRSTKQATLNSVSGEVTCDAIGGVACTIVNGVIGTGKWTFLPNGTDPLINDTDYLASGFWLYVPENAAEDYEFGVFADGSEPFNQTNLASQTGSATYSKTKGVIGVYTDADQTTTVFDANVMLTVDFDDADELGTIHGTIDGFTDDRIPTVTLKMTDIGDANSGFFTGGTSIDGDMREVGKWGGQFYGNGESDGRPGSVAGTFGASTENQQILGAFQANKQ